MRSLLLTVALALAACTGPSGGASEFGSARPTVAATPDVARLEQTMWSRLNRDRAARSLPPLAWDPALADVARAHSLDMLQHDFFAHESPTTGVLEDRLVRAGYAAYEMRENLAVAIDVERAEDNLLKSPGHYANIVATGVTHLGIGIVSGGLHGEGGAITVTQVFARPVRVDSPEQAVAGVGRVLGGARQRAGLAQVGEHPVLLELARRHIAEVDERGPSRTLSDIAKAAAHELGEHPNHGIRGLQLFAQVVFTGEEIDPGSSFTSPRVRLVGIAAAPARDERGRPRVKVLVVFGE